MSILRELKRRNVIRVAIAYAIVAWLLIEVTATIFPILKLPDWAVTLVTALLLIGFPVALIFAWAFEITPEGIKREKDVERSQSSTHVTGRNIDYIIIAVLVLALGYFTFDKFVLDPSQQGTESGKSEIRYITIAVLPFTALSSGEDDGYFADGLTEEILNALAQLPELQVTARTSSFFFKGQNIPVPEIAVRLNVAHIVEGSVRRDGERLRITAQLNRASDGFHLWSQTYNRTLDDVFAVQEDIAEKVAEALNVVLDENARRVMRSAGIHDVEAFIAYQKGLDIFDTTHERFPIKLEPLAIANVYFDLALEVAPSLTMARVNKADLAAHTIFDIAVGIRDEQYPGEAQETLAALREEFELAWRLSPPGNQRDILDVVRTLFSEDWSTLPGRIAKAMRPGRCPHMTYIPQFIGPFGWAEQIAEKYRETLACDPMDSFAKYFLPTSLIWAGDPEAALHAIEEAENKGLGNRMLEQVRFSALLAAGHINDPAVRGPLTRFGQRITREALAGDPAVARQIAEEYWSRSDANDSTSLTFAARVGDRVRANKLAARIDASPGSAEVLAGTVYFCFCGAPFDLEATPNFKARIEEAGFPWPPPKRIDYPTKTW